MLLPIADRATFSLPIGQYSHLRLKAAVLPVSARETFNINIFYVIHVKEESD